MLVSISELISKVYEIYRNNGVFENIIKIKMLVDIKNQCKNFSETLNIGFHK